MTDDQCMHVVTDIGMGPKTNVLRLTHYGYVLREHMDLTSWVHDDIRHIGRGEFVCVCVVTMRLIDVTVVVVVLGIKVPEKINVTIDLEDHLAAQHNDGSTGNDAPPSQSFARSTDPFRRNFYYDELCNYACERAFNGGGQRDRDRRRQRTADNQRAQRRAATHIANDAAELYEGIG